MNASQQATEIERQALRALCQESRLRESARNRLRAYHWREAVHQAVFDVLMTSPWASTGLLQSQLAARLTRRGFPDAAWEDLFQPHRMSLAQAEELIDRLGKE